MTKIANALLREEVLELLSERPDLVAVADAVAATHARPRRARRAAIAVAAGLAAALALAVWHGGSSPSFAERAEAAIGTGPVLHVVVEAPGETTVVDLASGTETRLRHRIEYRYDAERRRLRTRVTLGGRVTHDVLQTRRSPELDPALLGFVSGYREALATKRPVADVVRGRRVFWLEFGTGASRERVAIDRQTLTPLFIQSLVGARTTWRVREIRARERRASDFAVPARRERNPTAGSVVSSRRVAVLPPPWLRVRSIDGVKLVSAEVQQLVRGYARRARPPEHGVGAQLRYRGRAGFVQIKQAPRREPAYAYLGGTTFSGAPLPKPGRVLVMELRSVTGESDWLGQLRVGPMFVTISATSRPLLLDAARALESRPRRRS